MQPYNPATSDPYTGSNGPLLARTGYASGQFATFRQWITLGRVVAKGQRAAAKIVRPRGKGDDGRTRFRKMAVFALEQTVPLEPRETERKASPEIDEQPEWSWIRDDLGHEVLAHRDDIASGDVVF